MGKLMGHPNFSTWMSDPVMMAKIQQLQANPQQALQSAIGDPTMHPVNVLHYMCLYMFVNIYTDTCLSLSYLCLIICDFMFCYLK